MKNVNISLICTLLIFGLNPSGVAQTDSLPGVTSSQGIKSLDIGGFSIGEKYSSNIKQRLLKLNGEYVFDEFSYNDTKNPAKIAAKSKYDVFELYFDQTGEFMHMFRNVFNKTKKENISFENMLNALREKYGMNTTIINASGYSVISWQYDREGKIYHLNEKLKYKSLGELRKIENTAFPCGNVVTGSDLGTNLYPRCGKEIRVTLSFENRNDNLLFVYSYKVEIRDHQRVFDVSKSNKEKELADHKRKQQQDIERGSIAKPKL